MGVTQEDERLIEELIHKREQVPCSQEAVSRPEPEAPSRPMNWGCQWKSPAEGD